LIWRKATKSAFEFDMMSLLQVFGCNNPEDCQFSGQ